MLGTEAKFTITEILDILEESRKLNLRLLKDQEALWGEKSDGSKQLHGMIAEDKLLKRRFEKLYSKRMGYWQ